MEVFKVGGKRKLSFGVVGEPEPQMPREQMPRQVPSKTGAIQTPQVLQQTGTVKDLVRDASRKALLPGKRISKTGKVYWETRRNRSDAFKSNV